jgi:hypothetical protein
MINNAARKKSQRREALLNSLKSFIFASPFNVHQGPYSY